MPYEVDSPLASGLGFAASYLQGKQQRAKDQQQFAADQAQLNLQQQQFGLEQNQDQRAAKSDALANTVTQQGIDASNASTEAAKKMSIWFAAHPQPDINDTKKYGAWVGKAVSYAHSVGANDVADKLIGDYRTGQLGNLSGANATYTGGAKTNETNSVTRLNNSRAAFEAAHTANEKGLFAHQLQLEREKGQTTLQSAYVRANAMIQAQASRISNALQVAKLNNDTKIALAQAAAMNMANGKSDTESISLALADYKERYATWSKDRAAAAAGHAPEGYDPNAAAPTPQQSIQMFMPSNQPAAQSPISIVVNTPQGPQVQRVYDANNTAKIPPVRVYVQDEVPAVVKRLAQGQHREDIVGQYEQAGVSPQQANQIIALAQAQLHRQKMNPQPAAAPAPSGNFIQNAWTDLMHHFGH